ncbi:MULTISPECIES: single-stranded DNA-binding protein [unclassified Pseudoclavibacter]|uniref:single-stranded DNA-binding protein n=1 Tax=unclassified Pseudoclavibacter TaxID=2615177 RepID=UPI001787FEC4|nr:MULTISPECIES: single-stranded DNA-binding protein [unclassified Pseudoclavibacter]
MSIDTIAVNGLVATEPQTNFTRDGKPITSFRLASNQRRFDQKEGRWVDGDTNWFTVTAFRQLATHAQQSLFKGQRVLVQGRLRVKQWQNEERSGTTVEIVADNMGHDLVWGISALTKPERQPPAHLQQEGAPGEVSGAEDSFPSADADASTGAPEGGTGTSDAGTASATGRVHVDAAALTSESDGQTVEGSGSTTGAVDDAASHGGLEDHSDNWTDTSAQPRGWNEPGMQSDRAAATLGG